jgi:iron complex outermembrane receptor protein
MTRQNAPHVFPRKTLLALSIAALLPAAAQAQRPTLEEVLVTAEHREASIQDTQISISALSSMDIQELGISSGADIGHIVPNVTITNFIGGRTGFGVNIRGIGNNETLLTYDPAVGMYINDVLISKNSGGLLDVVDMERIEVLRGPQGTLYGRNTMGGAVNIVSRRPTSEFEGGVETTFGRFNQRDVRGRVNLPLLAPESPVGELSLRLSAGKLKRDGIQDNDFSGAAQSELGTRDREMLMGQLLWRPIDP